MATKVGINGFGRIGRNLYRAYLEKSPGFEIVAVNDLAAPDVLAHVLKYDSSHGVLDGEIGHAEGEISVDGKSFKVLSERDPTALPWKDMGVEVVVESTGLFTDREGASQHLTAGAKKVVISAPARRRPPSASSPRPRPTPISPSCSASTMTSTTPTSTT